MKTGTKNLLATGPVLLAATLFAMSRTATAAEPIIISGVGNISPLIEQYRGLLGDNLGNKPPAKKGRREVNWDGVPDEKAAPAFLAPDTFANRGIILNTPGEGVQVSARPGNPAGVPPRFGNINPTYVSLFNHFSAERLFSPIGSNAVDVTFVVPGTAKAATVRGFGAVYVDVDQEHTAFEFFDRDDKSLGRFAVPANDGGFSFLGVAFAKPIVARVHIDYGTDQLGPDDSAENDVAVMDDFIYDEPRAIRAKKVSAAKPNWK
jgi:hypothetical protein